MNNKKRLYVLQQAASVILPFLVISNNVTTIDLEGVCVETDLFSHRIVSFR